MIVRIQRFKLCFLFILHLDRRDQRGQNELPFVVDERAAADSQRLEQPPVEHPCVLILHFVASFPSPRSRR